MIWLIFSIILGSAGQIFFKMATGYVKNSATVTNYYIALFLNYYLWLGLTCYAASLVLWLWILQKYELSFAYPMVGLGYIITTFMAIFFLGEEVSIIRWIGILLIVTGLFILNISKNV